MCLRHLGAGDGLLCEYLAGDSVHGEGSGWSESVSPAG